MKFLCLGYIDEKKWDAVSKSEQDAMMQECFAYDDVLRKNGHFVGGEGAPSPESHVETMATTFESRTVTVRIARAQREACMLEPR